MVEACIQLSTIHCLEDREGVEEGTIQWHHLEQGMILSDQATDDPKDAWEDHDFQVGQEWAEVVIHSADLAVVTLFERCFYTVSQEIGHDGMRHEVCGYVQCTKIRSSYRDGRVSLPV